MIKGLILKIMWRKVFKMKLKSKLKKYVY